MTAASARIRRSSALARFLRLARRDEARREWREWCEWTPRCRCRRLRCSRRSRRRRRFHSPTIEARRANRVSGGSIAIDQTTAAAATAAMAIVRLAIRDTESDGGFKLRVPMLADYRRSLVVVANVAAATFLVFLVASTRPSAVSCGWASGDGGGDRTMSTIFCFDSQCDLASDNIRRRLVWQRRKAAAAASKAAHKSERVDNIFGATSKSSTTEIVLSRISAKTRVAARNLDTANVCRKRERLQHDERENKAARSPPPPPSRPSISARVCRRAEQRDERNRARALLQSRRRRAAKPLHHGGGSSGEFWPPTAPIQIIIGTRRSS